MNITGLPEGTGIVTLTLKSKGKKLKPSRKPIPVTARVTADQTYSLITRMRARK